MENDDSARLARDDSSVKVSKLWIPRTLGMTELRSFETSRTSNKVTQLHSPEDVNLYVVFAPL
jgi:hypothetical protein